MEIPILIEPLAKGFRASTQSPVPLSVEAGTEAAAMDALTAALRVRLSNGGKIRSVNLPLPETAIELAERMRTNPVHTDMLQSIEEYRKTANAVEETE